MLYLKIHLTFYSKIYRAALAFICALLHQFICIIIHKGIGVQSGTIKTLDSENVEIAVGIFRYVLYNSRYAWGIKYPPAAGKRRQKTAAGTRVKVVVLILFIAPES